MKHSAILLMAFMLPFNFWAQQNDEVHWITFEQLDSALAKQPKKTLLFFYADWCVYCKKMKRVAFNDKTIISRLNKDFYCVKLNAESTDTIYFDHQKFDNEAEEGKNGYHQLALLLGSRKDQPFSLPVTILLNESFRVVKRNFQYMSPKQLLEFVK